MKTNKNYKIETKYAIYTVTFNKPNIAAMTIAQLDQQTKQYTRISDAVHFANIMRDLGYTVSVNKVTPVNF